MKLIHPYFEILEQDPSMEGLFRHIELCGRNAYKSEDKITDDSAKAFVDKICKAKHASVLEHGTLYFKIPVNVDDACNFLDEIYTWTKCKLVQSKECNWWAVTTNFRVMMEHFAPEYIEDLIENYMCEPTEYHEKRVSVRFVCSRAISHELVRHRVFTFTQESQRYCNYSKDKFGNDITFIIPEWCPEIEPDDDTAYLNATDTYDNIYLSSLKHAESAYLDLLKQWDEKIPDKRYASGFKNNPWTPQQAREVLPNSTKTDIIMTGFVSDWKHFFELRTAENAHPEMRRLAISLKEEFIKIGVL